MDRPDYIGENDRVCFNCHWFVGEDEPGFRDDVGECRAHSPLAMNVPTSGHETSHNWPTVFDNDFCGDFSWSKDSNDMD